MTQYPAPRADRILARTEVQRSAVASAAENVSRRVPFGDKSALPLGVKTKGGKNDDDRVLKVRCGERRYKLLTKRSVDCEATNRVGSGATEQKEFALRAD